jgi:hypothetical protein
MGEKILPPNFLKNIYFLRIINMIDNLVMQWIAEGFIPQERGRSHREVAESYFYELINRNMIQPLDIGVDGKASGCRVHDMLL